MYRQNPLQNLIGGMLGFPTTPGFPGGGVPGFPGGGVPGFPGGGIPGFPGGGPGFPGGGPGFPGGGPGFPGGGPGPIPGPGPMPGPGPGPGPGSFGPPSSPPPSFVPPKPGAGGGASVFAVNPGAIQGCRFRYTYIWQSNGDNYWAYLTFVGRNSIAGFRWIGFTWVYFGLDLRFIDQFVCF